MNYSEMTIKLEAVRKEFWRMKMWYLHFQYRLLMEGKI